MDIKKVMAGFIVFLMLFSLVGYAYAALPDTSFVSYDDFTLELDGDTIYKGENMSLSGTFVSHIDSYNMRNINNPNVRLVYQVVSDSFLDSWDTLALRGSFPAKTAGETFTNIDGGVKKGVKYEVEFEDVRPYFRSVDCGNTVYVVYQYFTHDDRGSGSQIYQFQRYGEGAEIITKTAGPYTYSCEEKQTFIVEESFSNIRQWIIDLLNGILEVVQNA